MPELYEGQTVIVATKLHEAELLLASNQERLAATADPARRAELLTLIAGQSGQIGAYRRQLQKCQAAEDLNRSDTYKIRFSPAEREALEQRASERGQTLAQYIREACGL